MTVYKAIKAEAEAAAELAVALATGRGPPSGRTTRSTTARSRSRRSSSTPVAVTKDNIKDTIIKDGFWTVDEICTGKYAAGLQGGGHPVGDLGRMPGAPTARPRPPQRRGDVA